MMHEWCLDRDICAKCGVTGLELRQEMRLQDVCDYDVVQEYRARAFEFKITVDDLFKWVAPKINHAPLPYWERKSKRADHTLSDTAANNIRNALK